ncbi:hypothetical protein RhiirA1_462777 [Rhizophagus irregularis]|uniref:Uncharacterized protein n=1 Tax=Rhizophagus irregularis TaxID=588596 RepID=A0A2N0RLK4_9GLOM|nr:hypothetical protein RhiirA1_462777 [Rhizophagus irregularis]
MSTIRVEISVNFPLGMESFEASSNSPQHINHISPGKNSVAMIKTYVSNTSGDFREFFSWNGFFRGLQQFPTAYQSYLSRKEFRCNDQVIRVEISVNFFLGMDSFEASSNSPQHINHISPGKNSVAMIKTYVSNTSGDFREFFSWNGFFRGLQQFPTAYQSYLSRKEFRCNDQGIDKSFRSRNISSQSYNWMSNLL